MNKTAPSLQLSLLDRPPAAPAPKRSKTAPPAPLPPRVETQAAHLARVSERIGEEILAFCADRLARNEVEFVMAELQQHVAARIPGVAPDSPSRILRHLRHVGALRYELVSRRGSRYRVLPLATKTGAT